MGYFFGSKEDHQQHLRNYIDITRKQNNLPPVENQIIGSYLSLKDTLTLHEIAVSVRSIFPRIDINVVQLTDLHYSRWGSGYSGKEGKVSYTSPNPADRAEGFGFLGPLGGHVPDRNRDDNSGADGGIYGGADPRAGGSKDNPNPADQAQGYGHVGPPAGAGFGGSGGVAQDAGPGGASPTPPSSMPGAPRPDRSPWSQPPGPSGGSGGGDGGESGQSGESPGSCGEGSGAASSGGGGGEGGGDGCGGGTGKPVLLDLDGDGIELTSLEDSTAFYDIHGDGFRYHLSWLGSDDGILAYDRDGDGRIGERGEISFVDYVEGARTDLEGLRHFDSDGDGRLSALDAQWGKFRVWRDLDGDGESDAGELQTLAAAGIVGLGLSTSGGRETREDGTEVYGRGTYGLADGGRGHLYDVGLRVAGWGYRETAEGVEVRWTEGGRAHRGFVATTDAGVVKGAEGRPFLVGGGGADRLWAAGGGSVLLAGLGGGDDLRGGEGDDWLVGGAGADVLAGGSGDDVLAGGEGADRIEGGAGNDVLLVDGADTWGGGAGIDTVYLSSEADTVLNVSDRQVEVFHSGSGDDRLSTARDRVVALYGGAGNDVLVGGWGADFLAGGSGADRLEGGYGSDTYFFGRGDGRDTVRDHYSHLRRRTRVETYSYRSWERYSYWSTERYWYQGGEGHYDGWRTRRVRRTGTRPVTRTGTRTVAYQAEVELDAGDADAIRFGAGITVADLRLRRSGAALEIAVRDPVRPDATFDALADRVRVEDWAHAKRRIEWLRFADGTELSLAALAREYGLPAASGVLDLGVAMAGRVPGAEAGAVLAGTSQGEHLGGTSGDETLFGGLGDDVYHFGAGGGRDRVLDEGTVMETRTRRERYSYRSWESYSYWSTERYWYQGGEGHYDGWRTRRVRRTGARPMTRTGTRTVEYRVAVAADGGDDLLLMGEGVVAEHLLVRLVGADLEIALKDPSAPGAGFEALADRIVLSQWEDGLKRVERLGFADGTRLSLAWVVEKFGVVRDGAAVDLGEAMAVRAGADEAGGEMALTEANAQRLVTAMAAWSAGHGGHDGGELVSIPGGPSLADTLAAAWQPGSG